MKQTERLRVGIGPFIGNIATQGLQSLDKDLGGFIIHEMLANISYLGIELIQALVSYLPFQTKNGRLQAGERFTFRNFSNTFFSGDSEVAGAFFCGDMRNRGFLVDLVLKNFKLADIRFQQRGDGITGDGFRRDDFFKIIEKTEQQFNGIGMGIGALGAKIVPYFAQSLQVYLGNLVPLP